MIMLLRFLFISMFSFVYADCIDINNETECEASDHCEWHADEMACEDHGHDDDHDEHDEQNEIEVMGLSEGFTTFTISIMHDGHADYTSMPIPVTVGESEHDDDHDDHEHCDEITDETECEASDHCEWHADEMACEDHGHDDDHDDHDDHDHGDCGDFDHLNVDGLSLKYNDIEIYSQFQGYVTGALELHVDETLDLSVHFFDQDGNEIVYSDENPADCFPISVEVNDPSIVSISIEEHEDDDHDDHDDHEHCDEITDETECEASDHCEWHADEMACEDHGHDDDHECMFGDVNSDEEINVQDIVAILSYILDGASELECADMNQDINVDVLDIVVIVDIILGQRSNYATSAKFTKESNKMLMSSDGSIGAIQMTLNHGIDFTIELTNKAMIAEYRTNGLATELIIVNPTEEILFITDSYYNIEEIVAATTEGYIETSITTPNVIAISDAFPNPFNPSTSFNVNIENSGFISVSIYNINGQLVDILHEGEMNAGLYNMTWKPNNVSSGVYILRAVSEGYMSTQKLTLIK